MTETEKIAAEEEQKEVEKQAKLENELEKAIKNYVEEGQNKLLLIKTVKGVAVADGDKKSVEDFYEYENREDITNIVKAPKTENLKTSITRVLPKLKAPLDMENEDKFWRAKMVLEQVSTYFCCLNWKKSKGKPDWWPRCLTFEKFHAISYNTLRQNKLILKSILEHYNLNPETHCEFPEMPQKKKRVPKKSPITKKKQDKKRKVYKKKSKISEKEQEEEEDDPAMDGSGEEESDINNSQNSGRNGDRSDEEEDSESGEDRIKNRGVLRNMHPKKKPSPSGSSSSSS